MRHSFSSHGSSSPAWAMLASPRGDCCSRPANFSAVTMCRQKAMVKNADMLEEMQQDSVEWATQELEKYNIEKDIAAQIEKEFDKK